MTGPIIRVDDLSKRFKTKVKPEGLTGSFRSLFRPQYRVIDAVDRIGFQVERGEILAFIGPNGAGKSTTIKMLTGILYPSSGEISVLGFNPAQERRELAFKIGSVFGQKSQLWFHLPPTDSFRLLAGIYEIPDSEYRKRLGFLTELFEMEDLMDIPVRKLSLGQRIRAEIAASLLHKPEVIFLDEPTIGLDVVVKQKIRELITQLNREENTTIFLTSHDTGDIEQLCQRAIIINHGKIVVDQDMNGLKSNYLNRKIISVAYRDRVEVDLPGIKMIKEHEGGLPDKEIAGQYTAKIEVDTQTGNLQQIVHQIMGLGDVLDISIADQPMEEIIAAIYTEPVENG